MTTEKRKKPPPTRFSLVGAGRMGTALGRILSRSSRFRLEGIICGSLASSRRAAARIGRGRGFSAATAAVGESNLVLICVPDRQIAQVARALAASDLCWKNRTVLHTSGAQDRSELSALARKGAHTGSIHPLQTLTGGQSDVRNLRGAPVFLEGDARAVRVGREIARALGGRAAVIPAEGKTAYHLCACFLSNYLVCLVSLGLDLLPNRSGRRFARDWIGLFTPLLQATVANLEKGGPAGALTGPISRGDSLTLKKHLDHLDKAAPELRELHRLLALRAVSLAEKTRRLTPRTLSGLRRMLRPRKK